jgi:hypothetical protein
MIAALFGVGLLTGEGSDPPAESQKGSDPDVERVARRLERIRKLDFERIPPVRTITAEEAREEGLAVLDEEYPAKRRAADEKVLTLLGLIPAGSDIRELAGTIFAEEVAGFYDDRTKAMTLVAGASGGTEGEITLAHELTHALEDQHFDIAPSSGLDDARTARTALIEGTATVAMADYAVRFLTGGAARRADFLGQLALVDLLESSSGLPPYVQRSLLFPYSAGARFVDAIGTWRPVNRALQGAGPVSTEQVLHPQKYRARERPLRVATPPPPPGPGFRKAASGTIGEFDTAELIRSADSHARAERAAAGWGGGRYVLWRSPHVLPGFRLALAWRWDTPRDAAEFVAALPRYIERTLRGRRFGPGMWETPAGDIVTVEPGRTVRLAIGPAK